MFDEAVANTIFTRIRKVSSNFGITNKMPSFEVLTKVWTANGRAYLTLRRAKGFAIGPIGAAGRISLEQRALLLLLRENETDKLFMLLGKSTMAGQLYALLGMFVRDDIRFPELLSEYAQMSGNVTFQSGCFKSSQPIRDIVAHIQDGTYSRML